MKVSQAIEQLYSTLPFLTDKFSSKVGISSVSFSGTEATVVTDSSHELEVGDTCTMLGLYSPLEIASIARSGDRLSVVTSSNHDLTQGYQSNIILSGSNEPEFNGSFPVVSVDSSNRITLSTVDSGPTSATGLPIIEQTTGFSYESVVGYKTVTSVPDLNSFTYEMESELNDTIVNTGSVAVGYRITGAVSFENAHEMYTSNDDGEYWAFVVSGSNTASKDRKNNSDAVYVYNTNTSYRQELNQTFSVFVFATASNNENAYPIKDDMQDIFSALCKSLVGVKFDNGFEAGDYYGNVFDTHLMQFYNSGIYAHNFMFQTTTQMTEDDIYVPSSDVAFNTANISMNVILADMELKPDTESLDAQVDLRG
ncbi:MAG: hypothetical protein K0U78_15165 [Actinomycetia bacterium]|nr:hypothetical protein [Actinomycetes bacterium]